MTTRPKFKFKSDDNQTFRKSLKGPKFKSIADSCPHWIQLKDIKSKFIEALTINNEIILIANSKALILSKYNPDNDTVIEWIRDKPLQQNFITCFDQANSLIFHTQSKISRMNLNTETSKISYLSADKVYNFDKCSSIIIIDSKLHLIGGRNTTTHLIYNLKTDTIDSYCDIAQELSEFANNNICGYFNHIFVYLKQTNKLLLVTGSKHKMNINGYLEHVSVNTAYEYSIKNKKWKKLKHIIPKSISELLNDRYFKYSYINTANNRYTFLFITSGSCKHIFVLDVDNMRWYKHRILCPASGTTDACIINGNISKKTIILINGYIRSEFVNLVNVSNDLIRLIQMFCCNEFVHLMTSSGVFEGEHWKINVDILLDWKQCELIQQKN